MHLSVHVRLTVMLRNVHRRNFCGRNRNVIIIKEIDDDDDDDDDDDITQNRVGAIAITGRQKKKKKKKTGTSMHLIRIVNTLSPFKKRQSSTHFFPLTDRIARIPQMHGGPDPGPSRSCRTPAQLHAPCDA